MPSMKTSCALEVMEQGTYPTSLASSAAPKTAATLVPAKPRQTSFFGKVIKQSRSYQKFTLRQNITYSYAADRTDQVVLESPSLRIIISHTLMGLLDV